MRRTACKAILVCLAVLGTGCGKGLTLDVTAHPDPAAPGKEVQWDVSVRNDSPCATTEGAIDLPDPFPESFGAVAFIFGFFPDFILSPRIQRDFIYFSPAQLQVSTYWGLWVRQDLAPRFQGP